jgi:hypothetical protein
MMERAERGWHASARKNAAYFRDGLQIALLALRGFRKGDFTSIRIGTHLFKRSGGWWFAFSGEEPRTTRLWRFHFPKLSCPSSSATWSTIGPYSPDGGTAQIGCG